MSLRDNTSIPALPEYISLGEAATELGFTRQYMFRMASEGRLQTVFRIGTQPMFVVSIEEIERLKEARKNPEAQEEVSKS